MLFRSKILSTGIGYLNVRDEPSLNGSISNRVDPGETYTYTEISEDGQWYLIIIEEGVTGWVSGKYVEEVSLEENEQ